MVQAPLPVIYVVGSLNVDLVSYTSRIPNAGETLTSESFTTGYGGKGANQAVATARLASSSTPSEPSIVVKMVGAVGDDEFGPPLKQAMEAEGIDVVDVAVVKGQRTGVAVILVETSGENRILISPGANATVLPSTLPGSLLSESETQKPSLIIMQLETPLDTILHVCSHAKKLSIPVLLNPAPAIPLPATIYSDIGVVVVNESEAAMLTGIAFPDAPNPGAPGDEDQSYISVAFEAAAWFLNKGCNNVVVTLGALGAVWAFGSTSDALSDSPWRGWVQAAEVIPAVVDTTAAGDTFVGALSTHLVRVWSSGKGLDHGPEGAKALQEAVKFAVSASAWTVARRGTWDAMPTSNDLLRSS